MDKVVHFEIPADDVERANKFYSKVFGWDIQKFPMPEMEYYGVTTVAKGKNNMPKEAGAINGGMMKRNKLVKSIVIAANVVSVDRCLKKITEAGGKVVMPKTPIADMGFYAYVQDTEGNVIGIWEDAKKATPMIKFHARSKTLLSV